MPHLGGLTLGIAGFYGDGFAPGIQIIVLRNGDLVPVGPLPMIDDRGLSLFG